MRFGPFWPTAGFSPGGHCDLQRVAGLSSINYGAWTNLLITCRIEMHWIRWIQTNAVYFNRTVAIGSGLISYCIAYDSWSSNWKKKGKRTLLYLFIWSWAGGILRILHSDWFWERAVVTYLLTTGRVTNYAKRWVKLRVERAKFQVVLIVFCNRAVLLFNFERNFTQCKSIHFIVHCTFVDTLMRQCVKCKTWLFQFFLIVSPTF